MYRNGSQELQLIPGGETSINVQYANLYTP